MIRYGAATQRLRRPAFQSVMDAGLTRIAASGWSCVWRAVRRRFNQAADAVATEALTWARRLHSEGYRQPIGYIEWFPTADPAVLPTQVRPTA